MLHSHHNGKLHLFQYKIRSHYMRINARMFINMISVEKVT
eukprot:08008.XXX_324375_325776_1 [CDS] Oithona nana genome sequencing.